MVSDRSSRQLHRWTVGMLAMVLVALLAPTTAAQARLAKAPGDITPIEIAKAPGDVPVPPETALTANGVGAVGASERDFVVKVRLAGNWEIPAGNMAQEKSNDPRIRAIGKAISEQHVRLDGLTIEAAAKLGIPLPDEPTSEQRLWLDEMRAANGIDFDRIYVDRLRAAHGNIFPAIANIRAGTRNDIVRRLAQQANQFVMTHLTLLESSGLVDYGALPAPPQPKAAPEVDTRSLLIAKNTNGANTPVILIVLAAALIAGVVSTMRIFRAR